MVKNISPSHKKALQQCLREIRKKAGLSQVELSKKLGKPQSFVSKYESGERRLDILEVRKICEAVGITLKDFVQKLEKTL